MDARQIFGNFLTAIKTCFSKYLDPNGRAARPEYWFFFLFGALVTSLFNSGGSGIGGLISLIIFLPGLMVGIRRLHDVDKSGWWMLFVLLPMIGFVVLLVLFVREGTAGDNQYGSESDDFGAFEYPESDEGMDFNYEDLPRGDDDEYEVEDEASRTKDRYGRVIGEVKDKRKKGSDFLEG